MRPDGSEDLLLDMLPGPGRGAPAHLDAKVPGVANV